MTRNTALIVVAAIALVLAVGALVLQFAIPSKGGGASSAELDALRAQIASIKTTGAGVKVAFVNVDSAFQVFLNAVTDLRQRSADKVQQISDLQSQYKNGTVKEEDYKRLLNQYNTELLDANVALYASVLDRMIASSAFSDLRNDLQTVRTSTQTLLDESKSLVSMVKGGAISSSEFQMRLTQAQNYYSQIEKVVNQACAVKISQAAKKIAIPRGFDLVLIQKNVVLYSNTDAIPDLTDFVKSEISGYL